MRQKDRNKPCAETWINGLYEDLDYDPEKMVKCKPRRVRKMKMVAVGDWIDCEHINCKDCDYLECSHR